MKNEDIIDLYLKQGWKLLPIVKGTKEPPKGINFDTVDIDQYKDKWDKHDIAVLTGLKSNVIVIDADRVLLHWETLTPEVKQFIERLHAEHTKILNTRSGNKSFFFSIPKDTNTVVTCRQDIFSTKDKDYQIDVRGERGYNLIPFSAGYTWDVGQVKPIPAWLLSLLSSPSDNKINHAFDVSEPEEGKRHEWFMSKAGSLLSRGFTPEATQTHLRLINRGLENSLEDSDLEGLITRVVKMDTRNNPPQQKDVMSTKDFFGVFGDTFITQTTSKYPEFTTSFPDIDSKIWGIPKGKLTLVAGHPSTGKSLICQLSALRNAEQGKKVLLFSAEMPTKDVLTRLLIHLYGITSQHFLDGNFTKDEMYKLNKGKEYLSSLPLHMYDSLVGITQVETITEREKPEIIFLDYFQDCIFDNDGHFFAEEFVRRLHEVAKKHNIPVVLASQLEETWGYEWNNELKKKTRVKYEASSNDVRRTKALYQKADMIILLNSKDTDPDNEIQGDTLLKLRVGKNKINGEKPCQYFRLDRSNLRYVPIERGQWYYEEIKQV